MMRQHVPAIRLTTTACKCARWPTLMIALALGAGEARADTGDMPTFSFDGFGTFGVVHSNNDQADFVAVPFKPNGAGYTHAWSADVDSLIAGQLTVKFTSQLMATVQVISEQNYDNTYRPHVEWANIKYQFTPNFSVRIGRTALPAFMQSESRKVGYANPWVRPPIELYGLVPITSNDGVDASYSMRVGAATNTVQVTLGRSGSRYPASRIGDGLTVRARNVIAFADTYEHGYATLHLNFGRTRLNVPELAPLFDAFRQFGPEGIAIAEKYGVHGNLVTFVGMGASYDPGKWFVTGEWGRIDTRSVFGAKTAWYISSGRRYGKFTPYVTYAKVTADSNLSDPGLTLSTLPPALVVPATALNTTLNNILGAISVQHSLSIGARWDFAANTALKLQFNHIRLGAGSAGSLVNLQPGFETCTSVNVLSASIDFVF